MSDEKRMLLPSYLIEKESYVNESMVKENILYHNHGDNGSIVKDESRSIDEEQIYTFRNMSLKVNENFNRDFTLDVKYKGSVSLIKFNGDNKTSSATTITASTGGIYFTRWRGTLRKTIRYPEAKPDADGFLNVTLVRSGSQMLIYQYNVLQAIWTIGNAFANQDVELLSGNSTIKRFSLSMGAALPKALHYEALERKSPVRDTNLKIVNLRDDVYETSSFSTRMIKDITSYGQWMIALYDDNFMEAFSRPRGIDKGTSIEEITYDHTTSKTKIVFEDETFVEFDAIVSPAVARALPAGVGVLSDQGIHKPLVIGTGISKVTVPRGANKIIRYQEGELPPETVSYLTDSSKPMGPLDYSRRLTMKQVSKPGKVNYPQLNPSLSGGVAEWLPLEYEASTTNLDIFEINQKGEVTLPKGEIFIRGFFYRYVLQSLRFAFRITGKGEDLISKSWVTSKDVDQYGTSLFEFEERVFLFEEKTINLEEMLYYQRAGVGNTNETGTIISKIDFFKL